MRLAALFLGALIAAGLAPTAARSEETAGADSAQGRRLFGQNCSRCHGLNMLNPAPGVFDLRTFPHLDKARFVASVSEGKGAMPAWKAVLSSADIDDLWNYVSATPAP